MAVICMATEIMSYKPIFSLIHGLNRKIRQLNLKNVSQSNTSTYVCLTANEEDMPFRVHSADHISIFAANLDELCDYLQITPKNYIILCYLLGTAQRKALESNTLLQPHDLSHPDKIKCLFNLSGTSHDYIVQLDNPTICRGCRDFYHALGCDGEMIEIMEMIKTIQQKTPKKRHIPQ